MTATAASHRKSTMDNCLQERYEKHKDVVFKSIDSLLYFIRGNVTNVQYKPN
jgi:hypothetical protein